MADYDLVVIGAGATGLGAARGARRAGRRVALVEADRPGGDCTHYGCVPSKALLETARRVQAARSGERYGFHADVRVDVRAVMERVAAVVAEVERDESPELLASEGIELLRGWGTVTGPTSLSVDGRHVTFERLVVATGSRARVPPVEGLSDVGHLDNRTVFDLRELPEHLLVLGGGPIGVELAQAFRRLGAQVTLVEAASAVLSSEEPEAVAVVTAALEREGVRVLTGAQVVRAARGAGGPVLELADGVRVEGSHLLVAVGRTPATDGLGLETAGVALDDGGKIVTDERLQAADTVWAAGDCTSRLQFTHVGDEQGRLAAANAFAGRAPWSGSAWAIASSTAAATSDSRLVSSQKCGSKPPCSSSPCSSSVCPASPCCSSLCPLSGCSRSALSAASTVTTSGVCAIASSTAGWNPDRCTTRSDSCSVARSCGVSSRSCGSPPGGVREVTSTASPPMRSATYCKG